MSSGRLFSILALSLLGAACSSGGIDTSDSGPRTDASGPKDATPGSDATPASDTGVDADEGGPPDALASDAERTDVSGADASIDAGNASDAQIGDAMAGDTGSSSFGCGLPPGPLVPGELTCANCPSISPAPTVFTATVGAVTRTDLSGTVLDATGDGQFFVLGAGGRQLFGTVPVTGTSYAVTVPLFCGPQLVVLTFCNVTGRYALVQRLVTTECTEPDIRATVLWDALGLDWELHLIRPGGRINDNASDCTWTSCIGRAPDWGVVGDATDNPSKDVDDTGTFGPENIFLSRPENGTFTVMVEHWGSGSPLSDGHVILNVAGQPTVVVDINDFVAHFVRTVATIDWPSGAVRTSTIVHDCTGNWSGGCRDPIP